MDFTAEEYEQRDTARLAEMLAGPPLTWVFVGDGITQGAAHTHGWRGFVEHFAERLRGELGRTRDAVVNSGVTGAVVSDVLAEFHWRVGRFAPDVVTVMLGTNDALTESQGGVREFHYDVVQLVERSRDLGAIVILQTPPPVAGPDDAAPGVVSDYSQEVRAVASELGVPLVDHASVWARSAVDGAPASGWLDDLVHPSARGQHEIALALLDRLGILAADSPVCALRVDGPTSAPVRSCADL